MSTPFLGMMKLVDEDVSLLELIVPLLLIGLVVLVSLRVLKDRLERTRGNYLRRNHVLIIGMSRIGMQVAKQLLAQGRKVSIIASGKLTSDTEMLRKKGAYVLATAETGAAILEKAGLAHASICIVTTGSDRENLSTYELLRELKRKQFSRRPLRILVQLDNVSAAEVMKDYVPPVRLQGNSELMVFNEKRLAAQLMYDLHPPYAFLHGEARLQDEECICVLGFNTVAELFLVENSILTQYPDERRLKVLVVADDAENKIKELLIHRPYLATYLNIVPVELVNSTFAPSPDWSRKLIDAIPSIDAIYAFGDDDSLLFLQALHFRQFLYTYTHQARKVPMVVCMPEDVNLASLIMHQDKTKENIPSVTDLNIHFFQMVSDTFTVKNFVDAEEVTGQLAMAVNYFYSVRYDFANILRDEFRQTNTFNVLKEIENKILAFRPKTAAPLAELETMVVGELVAFTKNSEYRMRRFFGIRESWEMLNERKKDANRYVVRHIGNKVQYLEKSGTKELTREALEKQLHLLAPLEHKRWSAEKSAAGFASGTFPKDDKMLKTLLKDVLKVHDQLISFKELDDTNQKKDLDVFLILPVLLSIRKRLVETKPAEATV